MTQWFSVDKAGLGKQGEEQGKARLVGELIQNGLNEPGVTQINVRLIDRRWRRLSAELQGRRGRWLR